MLVAMPEWNIGSPFEQSNTVRFLKYCIPLRSWIDTALQLMLVALKTAPHVVSNWFPSCTPRNRCFATSSQKSYPVWLRNFAPSNFGPGKYTPTKTIALIKKE